MSVRSGYCDSWWLLEAALFCWILMAEHTGIGVMCPSRPACSENEMLVLSEFCFLYLSLSGGP